MNESNRPKATLLGVLGGMGPLAGATFASRLVQLTPAATDQDHIPVLLRNDPRIPDRSNARLYGGPDPLPAMKEGMLFLASAGATCIAIPCNTAHLWFEALRQSVDVPVLHIVDAVIQDLRRQGVHDGKVGVMGTPATLELALYQDALARAGYEPLVPTADEIERSCVASIAAVKGNRMDEAFAPAADGIRALKARGARAVVLGCTELPLAVPHARRGEFGLVLTDSIDALALAAIDHLA
jgi:aspartate racemase